MYTELKNVQLIISLLKQHNVRFLVLSPGSRNTPFAHTVENDSFFTCYSIVDERSAAFFALGLSESTGEPVVCSCTSSTASSNYLPAVELGMKENIPLILLTSDRDYRKLYQMEDQMINQVNMYGNYTVKSVNLPVIRDKLDVWYTNRSINEILIYQKHKKVGPIQINYQIDNFGNYIDGTLPVARKIDYINQNMLEDNIQFIKQRLKRKKRILILCGQSMEQDNSLVKNLIEFQNGLNCIVSYDAYSQNKSDLFFKTCMVMEKVFDEDFERLCPDLVITIGGHVWSFIKYKLREFNDNFEHWHVAESGEINDGLMALTKVFAVSPNYFFNVISGFDTITNEYKLLWEKRMSLVKIPELKYSNFYAINKLVNSVDYSKSFFHMSILNSIRLSNFSSNFLDCECFANLGTDGIDGCLSTFLGQTLNTTKDGYLIIGDLSSLYDISSFQYVQESNQKIMIINNHVGSEFYNNFLSYIDTVDEFIAAKHNNSLRSVCKFNNIKYLNASNINEFDYCLKEFINETDGPVIFEVFTDPLVDTNMLNDFYNENLKLDSHILFKKMMKKIKRIIGKG